jgi:bacterioferritin
MQGNPEVIKCLQEVLTAELTAINQYFLHAKMLKNWGYHGLADYNRHESIHEMKHAEEVTDRILFLDAVPNLQDLFRLRIGTTVKEMHQNDLQLEYEAVARLNKAVAVAVAAGDNGSRELFERILREEEEHVDFLEAELTKIEQMGYENYLTTLIDEVKGH